MNKGLFRGASLATLLVAGYASAAAAAGPTLPAPAQPFAGQIGTTYADSTPALPKPVTAPAGAPNVLLIMTDDIGFGAASTFGGPIPTPNLDRLAARGLVYNRFHTTAMCSPTRAALLTGRNHHAVGNGTVADLSTGFPGYWSQIPKSAATIAEVLKLNGYNTAMFGKHHDAPEHQLSTAGPYDLWPLGLGFEHFFGFMAAESNQYTPALYRDNSPIPTLRDGKLLDEALADEAIDYIHNQKAAAPDKPFFVYYAPGSAHAPHQAPKAWIEKFRGKFDAGWDAVRAETVERQIAKGLVPAGTTVTPRPEGIPAWASLTPDQKRINARMMEVYAAMISFQDAQVGRVLDEIDRMGLGDDTLVMFIEGDNGAAPEAGPNGGTNPMAVFANGMKESDASLVARLDELGGPNTSENYGWGWAWATNAPFPLFKQYASHLGGTRNGLVVSWPTHIRQRGLRTQFTDVNDVAPTILELAGVTPPDTVNGVKQQPIDGVSFAYSFEAPRAPERHHVQYFEMMGNQAIYADGWLANTYPERLPWKAPDGKVLPTGYKWELYDLSKDFAQAHDLAAEQPAKLAEMKTLFDQEARKNQVFPLDDRLNMARFTAAQKQHPPRDRYTYWGAGVSVPAAAGPPMLNRAFRIEAELELPKTPASGVVVALGGKFGGWGFYLKDGRPVAVMAASQLPADQFSVAAAEALRPGPVKLTYDFRYDGGVNAGGEMVIRADGRELARGRIPRTISKLPEMIDTLDVGFDRATPVVEGPGGQAFTGRISRVDISLGRPAAAGEAVAPTAPR